jgi:hypothetical protein
MEDEPRGAFEILHNLADLEARIIKAFQAVTETRAEIDRVGWSSGLDQQLKEDEQHLSILRRQRDRLRKRLKP